MVTEHINGNSIAVSDNRLLRSLLREPSFCKKTHYVTLTVIHPSIAST
ncbi:hypothetical protein H6G89_22810 [Oscillatoria sp. FACHB-1407]|nr:hypothetical protein [Oscillatoria sp. FACHB-1407]MBD2463837.1 hypothetical protein [Oscillatoria sp. FACHB-1407]